MEGLARRILLIMAVGLGLYALSKTSMASKLIKMLEGFSATPYQDSAGYWTIGYGHKIVAGDPYYPVGAVKEITEAEADALFERDMQKARNAVLSYTRVPLSSGQLDALTSFVFNVGPSAFASSTLLKKLNAGDYAGAANELGRWIHAGGQKLAGLVSRRETEKQVFLS